MYFLYVSPLRSLFNWFICWLMRRPYFLKSLQTESLLILSQVFLHVWWIVFVVFSQVWKTYWCFGVRTSWMEKRTKSLLMFFLNDQIAPYMCITLYNSIHKQALTMSQEFIKTLILYQHSIFWTVLLSILLSFSIPVLSLYKANAMSTNIYWILPTNVSW